MKYLFISTIFLYLFSELYKGIHLNFIISICCLSIVGIAIWKISRTAKWISGVFLVLGFILLFRTGTNPGDYISSFGPMLNLLSLFALVPILALPIRLGNYAKGIQRVIKKRVQNSRDLYFMTSGISYFFSCFMNLATLPMTYYSIRPSLGDFSINNKERFMSRAVTHGFAMPLLWTPVTPIVGIVIEMNGVNWASMLPYLIPLSFLGLALDWILAGYAHKKYKTSMNPLGGETAATLEETGENSRGGKLIHILLAILLFNGIVSVIEFTTTYDFVLIVTLLVIPFAFLWCTSIGLIGSFFGGLQDHFNSHLNKMKDQFVIFLTAGFFISAMKLSHADHLVNLWITGFKDVVGIQIFLVVLPLVPLILAFMGIHPVVGLALMAETLDPAGLNISSQLLTLSMLGGAVSAFLMGPFNATLGLMSSIVEESPYRISNWNAVFTFSYMVVLMIVLALLQAFM
ncbi:hypothetical protein [Pseudalkalibacillus decolorationis]|uniref:hypothetical protein n=1 Tax=Pseudalkalibacillus decolorationis TaxID=163879 RepID=UPI002147A4E3|nr:hypothetical protein [Pseudalkalibacillus decolorationis]